MGGESKESNNPRMKPSKDVTMLQTNTIEDNVDKDYTPLNICKSTLSDP